MLLVEQRPLLIGLALGRQGTGEPLSGRCGKRLASLCGLSLDDYLALFERTNLFPAEIEPSKAKEYAARFRDQPPGRTIIVLGAMAAAAFELNAPPFVLMARWGCWFAISPHPSGLNRWWNKPENYLAAGRFWRTLAQDSLTISMP